MPDALTCVSCGQPLREDQPEIDPQTGPRSAAGQQFDDIARAAIASLTDEDDTHRLLDELVAYLEAEASRFSGLAEPAICQALQKWQQLAEEARHGTPALPIQWVSWQHTAVELDHELWSAARLLE